MRLFLELTRLDCLIFFFVHVDQVLAAVVMLILFIRAGFFRVFFRFISFRILRFSRFLFLRCFGCVILSGCGIPLTGFFLIHRILFRQICFRAGRHIRLIFSRCKAGKRPRRKDQTDSHEYRDYAQSLF